LSEEELLGALEEAVDAELIVEVDEPGSYTFSHALIRETLYEELSTTRRMKLHRRVGQALEAIGAGDDAHVPELAHHFFLAAAPAAEHDKAVDYAVRAAHAAVERLAFEDAVSHLERALQVLEATEGGEGRRARILVSLGEAQRRAGDAAYRETLLEAGRLAGAAGDARLLAAAALANSRAVFSRTGQVDPERVALLEAAVAAVETGDDSDDEIVARLLASLGGELLFGGDRERRVKLSDRALAIARRLGDVPTLAHVLTHRHDTIWHASSLAERLVLADELAVLAEGLGDTRGRYNAALIGIGPALEAGDLALARGRVDLARRAALELAEPVLRWFVAMPEAVLAMTTGDLDEGERLVEEAFEVGAGTGQPDASLAFGAQLFTLRLLQGRLAEVGDDLVDAVAGNDAGPVLEAGLAWLACEVGQADASREILHRLAADGFGTVPADLSWLAAMVACAEVAARLGDQAHAAALVPLLEPYRDQFVTIAATVWWGSVAHYLGRLQTCLGRFYEAEADLAAAADAYTRLGAEPWAARVRRDQQTLADCRS
ncbi:MAG TPA: hypothetical protein VK848_03685, partial [Acidimicrobiia bacterium]|nr:hypothetical protein [Acidimicrobiia bacterium]